jgi:anti-sigma regulatory factor (Ser/Thr protein kinase)
MMTPSPHPDIVTVRVFAKRFPATPLGARSARLAALDRLAAWGVPRGGTASDTAALLVAELAANAATHGRVAGRDFELRLSTAPGLLLIEVSDTREERRPPGPGAVPFPRADAESGRGLLLVEALADRWCVEERDGLGKTVRAEIGLPR